MVRLRIRRLEVRITCLPSGNLLSFYLYHDHLCIPEVRKDGIQNKRDVSFYNERSLNLDNYFI